MCADVEIAKCPEGWTAKNQSPRVNLSKHVVLKEPFSHFLRCPQPSFPWPSSGGYCRTPCTEMSSSHSLIAVMVGKLRHGSCTPPEAGWTKNPAWPANFLHELSSFMTLDGIGG